MKVILNNISLLSMGFDLKSNGCLKLTYLGRYVIATSLYMWRLCGCMCEILSRIIMLILIKH